MQKAFIAIVAGTLLASGCSLVAPKKIDYKSAGKAPSLDVPPDLVSPTGDSRFNVPAGGSSNAAVLSAYSQQQAKPAADSALLPDEQKVRIERSGSQRWLVVNAPADKVWPVIKDFWQENGFLVNVESKETGVMETDWAENRAKIPQDMIRNTLGKVIDGLYSTPERDKFRTRIERGANDTTEIYISHRGMMEIYPTEAKDKTIWQPRPVDPELEAEFLRRLMVRLGLSETQAQTVLAQQQTPEQARIVKAGGGAQLEMDEDFERAWRRVGLALDRIGFAVEDRNRSKGVYYVRYIDPEVDNDSKKDDGLFARFAFWKSDKTQSSPKLNIVVAETGDRSRVTVVSTDGKPVDANTQTRIVNLLYKELR